MVRSFENRILEQGARNVLALLCGKNRLHILLIVATDVCCKRREHFVSTVCAVDMQLILLRKTDQVFKIQVVLLV